MFATHNIAADRSTCVSLRHLCQRENNWNQLAAGGRSLAGSSHACITHICVIDEIWPSYGKAMAEL